MTQKFMKRVSDERVVRTRNYIYSFRVIDATIWRIPFGNEDSLSVEKVGYYDVDRGCFVNLENTR